MTAPTDRAHRVTIDEIRTWGAGADPVADLDAPDPGLIDDEETRSGDQA